LDATAVDRPLLSIQAERKHVLVGQPEAVVEAAAQLGRLRLELGRALEDAKPLEEPGH